jgi:hypothetical protein
VVGVQNELVIVKDGPHFGVMFDADEVRSKKRIELRGNWFSSGKSLLSTFIGLSKMVFD